MRVQFRIRTLLTGIAIVAVGLCALRNPSVVWASILFTVAFALPLAAGLKAVASQGRNRLSAIGFCAFGLAFLHVSFNVQVVYLRPSGSLETPDPVVSLALGRLTPVINAEVQTLIDQEEQQARSRPLAGLEAARVRRFAYQNCCASLGSLVMASLGGLLGHWLARDRPS